MLKADERTKNNDKRKAKRLIFIQIKSPHPLADTWVERHDREITLDKAIELTGKKKSTVYGWSKGKPIDPLCLKVMQWYLWGCLVPDCVRWKGIYFTPNGDLHIKQHHAITKEELSALTWTLANYRQIAIKHGAIASDVMPNWRVKKVAWR